MNLVVALAGGILFCLVINSLLNWFKDLASEDNQDGWYD
jgi:hypothetical protein